MIAFYLLYGVSTTLAQNDKTHAHCKLVPMKNGDITYIKDTTTSWRQPTNSFIVSSANNEVYSLTRGVVGAVVKVKDYQQVGIKYIGDTVMEYSLLKDVSVKPGDIVNKGDKIGTGMPDPKTGRYETSILVKVFSKAKRYSSVAVMSFIKRVDN